MSRVASGSAQRPTRKVSERSLQDEQLKEGPLLWFNVDLDEFVRCYANLSTTCISFFMHGSKTRHLRPKISLNDVLDVYAEKAHEPASPAPASSASKHGDDHGSSATDTPPPAPPAPSAAPATCSHTPRHRAELPDLHYHVLLLQMEKDLVVLRCADRGTMEEWILAMEKAGRVLRHVSEIDGPLRGYLSPQFDRLLFPRNDPSALKFSPRVAKGRGAVAPVPSLDEAHKRLASASAATPVRRGAAITGGGGPRIVLPGFSVRRNPPTDRVGGERPQTVRHADPTTPTPHHHLDTTTPPRGGSSAAPSALKPSRHTTAVEATPRHQSVRFDRTAKHASPATARTHSFTAGTAGGTTPPAAGATPRPAGGTPGQRQASASASPRDLRSNLRQPSASASPRGLRRTSSSPQASGPTAGSGNPKPPLAGGGASPPSPTARTVSTHEELVEARAENARLRSELRTAEGRLLEVELDATKSNARVLELEGDVRMLKSSVAEWRRRHGSLETQLQVQDDGFSARLQAEKEEQLEALQSEIKDRWAQLESRWSTREAELLATIAALKEGERVSGPSQQPPS